MQTVCSVIDYTLRRLKLASKQVQLWRNWAEFASHKRLIDPPFPPFQFCVVHIIFFLPQNDKCFCTEFLCSIVTDYRNWTFTKTVNVPVSNRVNSLVLFLLSLTVAVMRMPMLMTRHYSHCQFKPCYLLLIRWKEKLCLPSPPRNPTVALGYSTLYCHWLTTINMEKFWMII